MQGDFLKFFDRFKASQLEQDYNDLCESARRIIIEHGVNDPIFNAINYLIKKVTNSNQNILVAHQGDEVVLDMPKYRAVLTTGQKA